MKSKLHKFAATAIVVGSAFAATAANAAPPPGSNGGPDHIRSAGSDTTYDMMNRLNVLYNASVGCNLNVGSPNFGDTCGVGGTECQAGGAECCTGGGDACWEGYGAGGGSGTPEVCGAAGTGAYRYAAADSCRTGRGCGERT